MVGPPSAPASVKASDKLDGKPISGDRRITVGDMPDVSLESGLLVTADGRVLWSRNSGERRAIASLTKMMTAVVAYENTVPTETITIPLSVSEISESGMQLRPGDRYTARQMLESLLVKSGNDSGIAFAVHISGSEEEFADLMNRKAAALGMKATHYENSHGLDAPGQYSTADDQSLIARYLMTKPDLRRMVGLKSIRIPKGDRSELLENTNVMLGRYEGANGVKTGWTDEAGYCVAASAARAGTELHAIVLGTETEGARFAEARELFDWGFEHYGIKTLARRGVGTGYVPVNSYTDEFVSAVVSVESSAAVFDFDGPVTRRVTLRKGVSAPVKRGDVLGTLTIVQGQRLLARVPLVADRDVEPPGAADRMEALFVRWVLGPFGAPAGALDPPD